MLLHILDVVEKAGSAPATGKDKALLFVRNLFECIPFLVAKILLPFPGKDLRHRKVLFFRDDRVKVIEREPQFCGELAAPVRFAGAHKAYQEYFHLNAFNPVISIPVISRWTSWVPS